MMQSNIIYWVVKKVLFNGFIRTADKTLAESLRRTFIYRKTNIASKVEQKAIISKYNYKIHNS